MYFIVAGCIIIQKVVISVHCQAVNIISLGNLLDTIGVYKYRAWEGVMLGVLAHLIHGIFSQGRDTRAAFPGEHPLLLLESDIWEHKHNMNR